MQEEPLNEALQLSKKPKLEGVDSEEDNSIVNKLQTLKSQDDILNCLDEIILLLPTAYLVSYTF